MPLFAKLRIVVIVIAVGLLSSLWLALPVRDTFIFGLSFALSGRMLLGFILLGLTCTAVESIVREHPKIQPRQVRFSFLHWTLPAVLVAVAWALLPRLGGIESQFIGVLVTSALLAGLIIAEYYTIDLTGRWHAAAQSSLRLGAYLLAMLLYFAICLCMLPALLAAIAVAAATMILGLRLLCDGQGCPIERSWPYVVGLGMLLGIASWPLIIWVDAPLLCSLLLVMQLYVLTGIARQFLWGRLTRWVALEYLFIGVLTLLLLLSYARKSR